MNIEQSVVINRLNRYLEWHNLPVRMNYNGICNGLASVYAKYALEGQRAEFFHMLQYIAGKNPSSEMEDKINHFVVEIALSFIPEVYDKSKNQQRSMEVLQVPPTQNANSTEQTAIKTEFNLALTTSDKNWATIIQDLDLRENEVMRIAAIDHTIAVSKENGKYLVYDPNYSKGVKKFSNEKDLINELHKNIFEYNKGPLGLFVQVHSHPFNPSARSFPKVVDIYEKYLNKDTVNSIAKENGNQFNTLECAAVIGDAAAIDKLLKIGAIDINFVAAKQAILYNNPAALEVLLAKIGEVDLEAIINFFSISLLGGCKEAFDKLLTLPICKRVFDNYMTKPQNAATGLCYAAKGGNPLLLEAMYTAYQSKSTLHDSLNNKEIAEKILTNEGQGDAIDHAINANSTECVQFLMKKIQETGRIVSEEQKIKYLLQAIKKNSPTLVSYLIKDISQEAIQTIRMSTRAVGKTDLSILQDLQDSGMKFSEAAQGIIDDKRHIPIGTLLSIGIMLRKFTDFCKEKFGKKTGISYTGDAFKNLKNKHEKHKDAIESNADHRPKR